MLFSHLLNTFLLHHQFLRAVAITPSIVQLALRESYLVLGDFYILFLIILCNRAFCSNILHLNHLDSCFWINVSLVPLRLWELDVWTCYFLMTVLHNACPGLCCSWYLPVSSIPIEKKNRKRMTRSSMRGSWCSCRRQMEMLYVKSSNLIRGTGGNREVEAI